MTSTSTKFHKAIDLAENLDQLNYVIEKLNTTSQINRRTKQGREESEELLEIARKKEELLILNGEQPF